MGLLGPGIQHESEALAEHGGATPEVFDEYTGRALPPHLVRKSREEEIAMMEDWEVWDEVETAEAYQVTGKPPLEHEQGR